MAIAWGPQLFGDPCNECGFEWNTEPRLLVASVREMPSRLAATLPAGSEVDRDGIRWWSVGEYISHVADNLRIWAERLVGASDGARAVAAYDQDDLAVVRRYSRIPLDAAMWSLRNAVEDWSDTVVERFNQLDDVLLIHDDRGALTLRDVCAANSHDAWHHEWDIAEIRRPRK